MKKLLFILFIFISVFAQAQYRSVDWRFIPDSMVVVSTDTYLFKASPIDYNDPAAIDRTVGNYVVDFIGNVYKVTDSTSTTLTVFDEHGTGYAPQINQIARCYKSVVDGDVSFGSVGGVNYFPLDESAKWKLNAKDNELLARAIDTLGETSLTEGEYLKLQDSVMIWADTVTYIATKSDISSGGVGGSGTDNVIPRWDGTTDLEDGGIVDNSDATAMTITSSERIGLGDKTSPSYVLDVEDSYSLGYVSRFVNTSITGNGIYAKGGTNAGVYPLYVANTDNDALFRVAGDGEIRMGQYGIGTFTGTVAKYLAVDASGNILEASGTSGSGDDWGAQVVVSDATLSGTGITGDPLSAVSSGLWTSGTNGIELSTFSDNVGIGVASSTVSKLVVSSSIAAGYSSYFTNTSSSGHGLYLNSYGTSGPNTMLTLWNGATNRLAFVYDGSMVWKDLSFAPSAPTSGYGALYPIGGDLYWKTTTETTQLNTIGGDMTKSIYDTNSNNIVDNSEALNSQSASYYLDYDNFTDTPNAVSDAAYGSGWNGDVSTPASKNALYDKIEAIAGGTMTYPGAGIALSTGTAWGTSITNNSSNWNTAYGWGDHSTEGYLTTEVDGSITNELQTIDVFTLSGSTLYLSLSGVPQATALLSDLYQDASEVAITDAGGYYTGTDVETALQEIAGGGGFSDPMTDPGDLIFKNSSNVTTRLAAGAASTVLQSDGTNISWVTQGAGHDALSLNANASAAGLSLVTQELNYRAATNAQNGYMTSALVGNIETNNAKVSNVSTALTLGTPTSTTVPINSDGSSPDITLIEATTSTAGLLGSDKWDEIVVNSGFAATPSSVITAGTNLSWDGNTLNSIGTTEFDLLTSTVSTTSSTLSDITGLSFTAEANSDYEFEILLFLDNSGTFGSKFGLNYSSAGATVSGMIIGAVSNVTTPSGVILNFNTATSSYLTSISGGGISIKGILSTGANTGNFTPMFSSDGGTTNISAKSFMKISKIN
jgi:hypothetical protein